MSLSLIRRVRHRFSTQLSIYLVLCGVSQLQQPHGPRLGCDLYHCPGPLQYFFIMECDLSMTNDRKDSETGSELDSLDQSLSKYINLGVWDLYIMRTRLLRYLPISLKSRSTRGSERTSHTCGGPCVTWAPWHGRCGYFI
ncbi:hypothetical protein EDB86DRAFT_209265 [Lactarius hatsudake]|nr:hypothetical protein EDB86DRAFT_209265 [Lactarius hatsudake]